MAISSRYLPLFSLCQAPVGHVLSARSRSVSVKDSKEAGGRVHGGHHEATVLVDLEGLFASLVPYQRECSTVQVTD